MFRLLSGIFDIVPLLVPLQKFFVGVEFAVFGSVVEGDVAVSALFELIDFAGVERLGVDVNADGALIVFGKIENLMDRFEGVDVTRIGGVHFIDVGRQEPTGAGVVGGGVAVFDAEILDLEAAYGGGHPTILVAMIVDARELADFPADGHTFEKIILENEVAGVAALGEENIFFEGVGADMMLDDKVLDVFEGEFFGGDGSEILNPVGDGKLRGRDFIEHQKPPTDYNASQRSNGKKEGIS